MLIFLWYLWEWVKIFFWVGMFILFLSVVMTEWGG